MNVPSRLVTLANLPEKADVYTMIMARQIRQVIDFNSEQVKQYNLQKKDDTITWALDKDVPNEFEFSVEQINYLIKIFQDINAKGEITSNILDFAIDLFNYEEV